MAHRLVDAYRDAVRRTQGEDELCSSPPFDDAPGSRETPRPGVHLPPNSGSLSVAPEVLGRQIGNCLPFSSVAMDAHARKGADLQNANRSREPERSPRRNSLADLRCQKSLGAQNGSPPALSSEASDPDEADRAYQAVTAASKSIERASVSIARRFIIQQFLAGRLTGSKRNGAPQTLLDPANGSEPDETATRISRLPSLEETADLDAGSR